MEYTYTQSNLKGVRDLMNEYIQTLSSPIDSFLEDHILSSDFYLIYYGANPVGYFAIHNQDMITQFYLLFQHLRYSQVLFKDIVTVFSIKSAFVPTCDELFLSMVLDQEVTVKKQAYFFQDSKEIVDERKLYRDGIFRTALPNDICLINEICSDFFDKLEERVGRGEIFVFMENNTLLGAGIIERGKVLNGYTSIGMYTNEQYRQKGVGRTIITYLKRWCYEHDQIPICGCWYYNINSKRTLESAGMITKTRLLNIEFTNR